MIHREIGILKNADLSQPNLMSVAYKLDTKVTELQTALYDMVKIYSELQQGHRPLSFLQEMNHQRIISLALSLIES